MKRRLRNIAFLSAVALLLAGFGLLGACSRSERAARLCNGLDVQIVDKFEFVTQDDVKGFLDKHYGHYIGMRLDSLDLDGIERMLEKKNVVLKSEAWTTPDGMLHVSIMQRPPVLRFQRGEQGFYMDKTGYVFPLHKSYTADVPVIEGAIPNLENGANAEWAAGVLSLMAYINGSKQWKDSLEKISVNASGDLELHFNGSKERFILGFPEDIESKFERIKKYYSHIVPAKGEGYYKSVNLKYNKQIICRKDI